MPIVVLLLLGAAFFAGRHVGRGERFGGPRNVRPPLGAGEHVEVLPPGSAPDSSQGNMIVGALFGPRQVAPARLPSPNLVLDEVVRMGAFPPPFLVQSAFAEARLAGNESRCAYIVGAFMAPVVAAALGAGAGAANAPGTPPPSPAAPSLAQGDGAAPAAAPPVPPAQAPAIAPAPAPGSTVAPPIDGMPQALWQTFAAALEREPVDYATDRHVGRYRHHRERLRELAIDADQLVAKPDAQDAALAHDIADACAHVHGSGMSTDFVGGTLDVPSDDGDVKASVTLSGVLAVCCAAGLEGAADWLTRANNRRRFPNTTAAFWRANGLF